MTKRIEIVLALAFSIALPGAFAVDPSPSEASVNQLLEVSQIYKILDTTMANGRVYETNHAAGDPGSAGHAPRRKDIEKRQAQ